MPRKTIRLNPPLNSAAFNAREITKQLLLAEDHLSDDDKYCEDCIRKHLMMVEALADEACQMDPDSPWLRNCKEISQLAKEWLEVFTWKNKHSISQEIRVIRKQLVDLTYKPIYS